MRPTFRLADTVQVKYVGANLETPELREKKRNPAVSAENPSVSV